MTDARLSSELGITSGQLRTWHLELLAAEAASAVSQAKAEATELVQLRRDNKRLQEENAVTRKASIFRAVRGESMNARLSFIGPTPIRNGPTCRASAVRHLTGDARTRQWGASA